MMQTLTVFFTKLPMSLCDHSIRLLTNFVKGVHAAVHEEILVEKEQQIRELTNKLEQLVRLNDYKIQNVQSIFFPLCNKTN